MSKRRLKRSLRHAAEWVWPAEARGVFQVRSWAAVSILAALFLHAESSSACVTVDPGRTPIIEGHAWMESLAADRSADVVHASARSVRRFGAASAPGRWTPARPERVAVADTEIPSLAPDSPLPASRSTESAAAAAVRAMPEGTSRAILQGEFAILVVQTLHLRAPRGGWSPERAINVLVGLRLEAQEDRGIAPPGGWQNGHPLTEGDVSSLLQQLGLRVIARNPERSISVHEAEMILARLSALFRELAPAAFTEARNPSRIPLGNPGRPPLSPAIP